jgi:hypothetical protein
VVIVAGVTRLNPRAKPVAPATSLSCQRPAEPIGQGASEADSLGRAGRRDDAGSA